MDIPRRQKKKRHLEFFLLLNKDLEQIKKNQKYIDNRRKKYIFNLLQRFSSYTFNLLELRRVINRIIKPVIENIQQHQDISLNNNINSINNIELEQISNNQQFQYNPINLSSNDDANDVFYSKGLLNSNQDFNISNLFQDSMREDPLINYSNYYQNKNLDIVNNSNTWQDSPLRPDFFDKIF